MSGVHLFIATTASASGRCRHSEQWQKQWQVAAYRASQPRSLALAPTSNAACAVRPPVRPSKCSHRQRRRTKKEGVNHSRLGVAHGAPRQRARGAECLFSLKSAVRCPPDLSLLCIIGAKCIGQTATATAGPLAFQLRRASQRRSRRRK